MIIFLLVQVAGAALPDMDNLSETNWPQPAIIRAAAPMAISRKVDIILSPFIALLGNIIR
jgi:hypothetical protein